MKTATTRAANQKNDGNDRERSGTIGLFRLFAMFVFPIVPVVPDRSRRYRNLLSRLNPIFASLNAMPVPRQPNPYFTLREKLMDDASAA